jgi:hypothetical protein
MEITTVSSSFPAGLVLGLVLVLGFIGAVTIGSIAWYNSKRPPGWETKERPDFIPKVGGDQPSKNWLQDLLNKGR